MNDSVEQFTLVYQPTAQKSHSVHSDSSVTQSLWHQSPSSGSPSSPYPSSSFPLQNHTQDRNGYPSPAASFNLHSPPREFSSPSDPSSPDPDTTFTQVENGISPARVLTRRQRTTHISALHIPSTTEVTSPTEEAPERPPVYFLPSSGSRPQSPITPPTLNLSTNSMQMPLHPTRFDSTSSTVSSVYPSYGFTYAHPHSRSNSHSHSPPNPRSVSPTLSAGSNGATESSMGSTHHIPQPSSALSPTSTTGNTSPVVERQKQRKQRLFNVDRKAICIYHMQYPNARQEDIAQRYGVERSTISKILKHKTRWMNVPEAENLRVAKHRPSKFPLIEDELVAWLLEASRHNIQLTDASIRMQAKLAAQKLRIGEDKFKASSGWIENFKHRHGIKKGKWVGRGDLARNISMIPASEDIIPDLPRNTGYGDLDLPANKSPDSSGSRQDTNDLTSMSLHSPWQRSSESSNGVTIPANSQDSSSMMHDPMHSHNQRQHPHAPAAPALHIDLSHPRPQPLPQPPPCPEADRSPIVNLYRPRNGYSDPMDPPSMPLGSYPLQPVLASSGCPTKAEVADAMSKLIAYVDAQPQGFLNPQLRESLEQVNYVLATCGVPCGQDQ